jgi:hypothetical protein
LKNIKIKSIINKNDILKKKKKKKIKKKKKDKKFWCKEEEKKSKNFSNIFFSRIINFKKVNCQKEKKKFIKST